MVDCWGTFVLPEVQAERMQLGKAVQASGVHEHDFIFVFFWGG